MSSSSTFKNNNESCKCCLICLDSLDNIESLCQCSNAVMCLPCFGNYFDSSCKEPFSRPILCPTSSCNLQDEINTSKNLKKRPRLDWRFYSQYLNHEQKLKRKEQAGAALLMLCSSCHVQKSILMMGNDDTTTIDQSNDQNNNNNNSNNRDSNHNNSSSSSLPPISSSLLSLLSTFPELEELQLGTIDVNTFYEKLITIQPILATGNDEDALSIIYHVSILIDDPELNAAIQLHHYSLRPRIITSCCKKEHCFRCRTTGWHTGISCEENSSCIESKIVFCPKCSLSLTKGDGCNIMTCVCGEQFSYLVQQQVTQEALHFIEMNPKNTADECVKMLIDYRNSIIRNDTILVNTEDDNEMISPEYLHQLARSYRKLYRVNTDIALEQWWKNKFGMYQALACSEILNEAYEINRNHDSNENSSSSGSNSLRYGDDIMYAAAQQWANSHRKEFQIASYLREKNSSYHYNHNKMLFNTFYGGCHSSAAALRLISGNFYSYSLESRLNYDDLRSGAKAWAVKNFYEIYNEQVDKDMRALVCLLYLYRDYRLYHLSPSQLICPVLGPFESTISSSTLVYTSDCLQARRIGSRSSYPGAYARLSGTQCSFSVKLIGLPYQLNWCTIGLSKGIMPSNCSDGFGRTDNTWGLRDDRSRSPARLPYTELMEAEVVVAQWRKLREGDVITLIVDTIQGRLSIVLNDMEEVYTWYNIPTGSREEYIVGATLSSDAVIRVIPQPDWAKRWRWDDVAMKKEQSLNDMSTSTSNENYENESIQNSDEEDMNNSIVTLSAEHSLMFADSLMGLSRLLGACNLNTFDTKYNDENIRLMSKWALKMIELYDNNGDHTDDIDGVMLGVLDCWQACCIPPTHFTIDNVSLDMIELSSASSGVQLLEQLDKWAISINEERKDISSCSMVDDDDCMNMNDDYKVYKRSNSNSSSSSGNTSIASSYSPTNTIDRYFPKMSYIDHHHKNNSSNSSSDEMDMSGDDDDSDGGSGYNSSSNSTDNSGVSSLYNTNTYNTKWTTTISWRQLAVAICHRFLSIHPNTNIQDSDMEL